MKRLTSSYVCFVFGLLLSILGGEVLACDQSYLQLDSAESVGGGRYRIEFQVCIGGGFNPPDTAGANNYTVDFYFDIFGSGVTIVKNTVANEFYPDQLNSGQSSSGCTNCRNACVFYGGVGAYWHDPSCTSGAGATCHSCPGPTAASDCPDTSACANGPNTCLWYSANSPCCNSGTSGSACNVAGFNYFTFWGIPFQPASCPGPPNSGAGCRNWVYTDIWNGSGTAVPYCDTMYITTQGLPDSIVARGIENTSGFSGDCWSGGDHPEQTIDLSTLPVAWEFLQADPGESDVTIRWGTAMELNNSHFLVKKSIDGNDFYTLERVEGLNLRAGFDGYMYVDENPENGISYYRITQVDQNGTEYDSKVVAVTFDGELHSHINSVFPVPAFDHTTISLFSAGDQEFDLILFDSQGKVVYQKTIAAVDGENSIRLDIADFEAGLYFIRMEGGGKTLNSKFVKY